MPELGKLVPRGGGDDIPLLREKLVVGRREKSDICLRFSNVSGSHCELAFKKGCWVVKDLNSANGVKVNGDRVTQKVLQPGDLLAISKHEFVVKYEMTASPADLESLLEDTEGTGMSTPLLEKAGLAKPGARGGWAMSFDEDDDDDEDDD